MTDLSKFLLLAYIPEGFEPDNSDFRFLRAAGAPIVKPLPQEKGVAQAIEIASAPEVWPQGFVPWFSRMTDRKILSVADVLALAE